ncbi:MAG: pro-sigmaK processing inhibitor BofA [Lachnospiraceae bacterium]|nr:pro-sigmaK processing inhibitor BofA [Lachnospiraceae bacterium]
MVKKMLYILFVQFLMGILLIYIVDKLFAMNGYTDVYVGINPVTSAFVSVAGIPGVAVLFAAKFIL